MPSGVTLIVILSPAFRPFTVKVVVVIVPALNAVALLIVYSIAYPVALESVFQLKVIELEFVELWVIIGVIVGFTNTVTLFEEQELAVVNEISSIAKSFPKYEEFTFDISILIPPTK